MFDVVGTPVAPSSPVLATDIGRLVTYLQWKLHVDRGGLILMRQSGSQPGHYSTDS